METPPPLAVVLSLSALIDGLFEAVCARYGVFPVRGPLVRFLWKRFARIKRHFALLAARFSAGASLSPRAARPRAEGASGRAPAFPLAKWVCPKFGWLRRIARASIGAEAFAGALRHLLTTDPEMRALLAATPATARILRPLCHMLGVPIFPSPPALPVASPRAAAPVVSGGREAAWPGGAAAMPPAEHVPREARAAPSIAEIVFFKAA